MSLYDPRIYDKALARTAELEAENGHLKHVIWMQRNERGLLNTSLTRAEAALAERDGMLDLLIEDDFGYAPGSIKADGLKDGYRARAKEDLK